MVLLLDSIKTPLLFLILLFHTEFFAQTFTELNFSIPNFIFCESEWVDYDNDGDLDLFVGGGNSNVYEHFVYLFKNEYGIFNNFVLKAEVSSGDKFSLVDYDNDNDVDIVILHSEVLLLYSNIGNDRFIKTNVLIGNDVSGNMVWEDYNNDGKIDVLIGGKLFCNKGNDQFELSYQFISLSSGSSSWGDYNNDGLKDLIMTGSLNNDSYKTFLYTNNDNNNFTRSEPDIKGCIFGNMVWVDIDNDGFPDIISNGSTDNGTYSLEIKIIFYRNLEGTGEFIQSPYDIPGTGEGSIDAADYNNDGFMDILLTGRTTNSQFNTLLYQNNFNEEFILVKTFPGSYAGNACWGDYDNDNDLDLFLTGIQDNSTSLIYRNEITVPNTKPSAPTGLISTSSEDEVILRWNASDDLETPQNTITYNLRIGTSPGTADIYSSLSFSPVGKRKIVTSGNTGHNRSINIRNLLNGTYYWGVQSIDNGFSASVFSDEQSFTISGSNQQIFTNINAGLPGIQYGEAIWGDYDGDGDLDLAVSGRTGPFTINENITRVYKNINGNFSEINSMPVGLSNSAIDWGDYNADGYLDLVVTGMDSSFKNKLFIYKNNGDDTFTSFEQSITATVMGDIKWGDYDNDGDLDFVMCGSYSSSSSAPTKIFRNEGSNYFSATNISLLTTEFGSVSWGDFDKDGDLDLAIGGGLINIARVYKNNGNDNFTDIGKEFSENSQWKFAGPVKWFDCDSDGDLDLIVKRTIYLNNEGTFNNSIVLDIDNFNPSSISVGDVDNDGDTDVLMNGLITGYSDPWTYLFRNNSGLNFIKEEINISKSNGNVSFGDLDNDGDLDILITGYDDVSPTIFNIYKNNGAPVNNYPAAPQVNDYSIEDGIAYLTWDSGSDIETESAGLNYNIKMENLSAQTTTFPPHSDKTVGTRFLPDLGNVQQSHIWRFETLVSGIYSWAVQSIDNSYAASGFSDTLQMKLFSQPEIDVDTIDFGEVKLSEKKDTSFIIRNTGNIKLVIKNIEPGNNALSVSPADTIISINGSCTFLISFKPEKKGVFNEDIILHHNGLKLQDTIKFKATVIDTAITDFSLLQNYPNPFNSFTTIEYALPVNGYVRLEIFNSLGEIIETLVDTEQESNRYKINWYPKSLSSGIYFYRITMGNYVDVRKLIYMK